MKLLNVSCKQFFHTFFPSRSWSSWLRTFSTLAASQNVTNPKPLKSQKLLWWIHLNCVLCSQECMAQTRLCLIRLTNNTLNTLTWTSVWLDPSWPWLQLCLQRKRSTLLGLLQEGTHSSIINVGYTASMPMIAQAMNNAYKPGVVCHERPPMNIFLQSTWCPFDFWRIFIYST